MGKTSSRKVARNKPAPSSRSTAAPPKAESKSLNRSLSAAKAAKKDVFYTQYVDIQKEVEAYLEFDPDTFRGKVVYCNYMSAHRYDNNINELKNYFNSVIDWVSSVFIDVLPEMKGLEWGRLYEAYHGKSYDPKKMADEVKKLAADLDVTNRKGIFEYILGGSTDTKLLVVRVFDEKVKKAAYARQTQAAESRGESNCPHCAMGHDANKSRIYALKEMDADHVAAWSKGGESTAKNCEMLCITHNRAKGNR